jgi:hypothetical protein
MGRMQTHAAGTWLIDACAWWLVGEAHALGSARKHGSPMKGAMAPHSLIVVFVAREHGLGNCTIQFLKKNCAELWAAGPHVAHASNGRVCAHRKHAGRD